MSRVRRGFKARQRRNKVLKLAKGYHFDRRTKYRHAVQTVKRALYNAYKGRKLFKRNMRRLWIIRIGAAARMLGTSYSQFISLLKKNNIQMNRKMLAELAITDFAGFECLYKKIKSV